MSIRTLVMAAVAVLGISACATPIPADQVRAPQPARAVDLERFYSGRWLEIARLPMSLTDGCVAGATTYVIQTPTRIGVRDTCQQDTPDGREKAIGASGTILESRLQRQAPRPLSRWSDHLGVLGAGPRRGLQLVYLG